jgi:hypothetical protein
MGYSKISAPETIEVVVTHPWWPGTEFTFTFPRRMPASVLERERELFGLPDAERERAATSAIIRIVAELLVCAPSGFDDLVWPEHWPQHERVEHIAMYFDDPEHPELAAIVVSAWRAYRDAAIPVAYCKSLQNGGPARALSSRASG